MKKLISFMLVLLMILPCVSMVASAKDDKINTVQSSDNVQGFIDDALKLTDKAPVIQNVPIADNGEIGNVEDSDDDYDFETCRLVVESEEKPDKLNSLGIASGFKDYHIVQFANAEDTEKAFEYYSGEEDVISVFVDQVLDLPEPEIETGNLTFNEHRKALARLDSWGADSTGLYELKDYLVKNDVSMDKVVVGVVDTGIDLDHEFFEGRIVRTYFNSSDYGARNSENDHSHGHGSMVSSVIVDSTPENIKVAVYKTTTTYTALSLGCLQAIEDEVDIINASFGGAGFDENYSYWEDIVNYAYENNIPFVAAAGNESDNTDKIPHVPSDCANAICVGAVDKYYMPTDFTNYGKSVDVSAPGKEIPVAIPPTQGYIYALVNGTSFSSPYTAALCAIYKSLTPNCTVDEIAEAIKSNASSHSPYFTVNKDINKLYGAGIIDAIGTIGYRRQLPVKSDVEPGDYFEEISVTLSSQGADEIYYTLDQSVPTKENGILYKGPIKISSGGVVIKAIAYSNYKQSSKIFSGLYKVWEEAPEESFMIENDGTIISCTSKIPYIVVPEKIRGITARRIDNMAFDESKAEGVMLPKTITELKKNAFLANKTIKYFYGEGVKNIGNFAFANAWNMIYAHFPNAETVGESAFESTKTLFGLDLPKVKKAGGYAFAYCKKMLNLNLPELESAGTYCFSSNENLHNIYVPELNEIMPESGEESSESFWFTGARVHNAVDLPSAETFYELDFLSQDFLVETNRVKRVEFSNLKQWLGTDVNWDEGSNTLLTLVMPSTVEEITVGQADNLDINGYVIYGSKGTYVEKWAKEQKDLKVIFVEITPRTAIITDLPQRYYSYMGELVADVVGFNRQYQWYANNVKGDKNAIPIPGATSRNFNPADYPAQYYYCEVTSTDKGHDPVVITTSICENVEMRPVFYDGIKDALNKVPSDLSVYTEESKKHLLELIEETKHLEGVSRRYVSQLEREIRDAIRNLKLIEVTFGDDEITLSRGDVFELSVESTGDLIWGSTDESVATVDNNGIVTAKSVGEATIIATLIGLGASAECKVTVVPKKSTVTWIVDGIKTEVILTEGDKIVKPKAPQKDGHIFKKWTPDVPDIMPSHDVEFTAVFLNCTNLEKASDKIPADLSIYTAQTRNALEDLIKQSENLEDLNQNQVDELAEKIEKAVSDLKLITITLSDKNITLTRGDVFKISAESELPVTWGSTNEDVATISEDGTVTAKRRGETTIIATVESLGITAECKVKVVPQKFTVTWNIDGAKIKVTLNEGDEVVEPEIPYNNFKGWTPEVPDIMPSENVEFTAVFEKAVVTSVKIKSKPTKFDYIYKTDNLDLTGLTLEVSYSDGTKEVVNDLSKAKVTGFDNTKLGTQTITIEYEGAKADFDITVSYAGWQYLILIFLLGFIWY